MDRISIVGGKALNGSLPISGAKNAALPLMIASLLTPDSLTLKNVPNLADVNMLARILRNHGVDLAVDGKRANPSPYLGETFHLTALAKGETVIENAAREPEIGDVADCLVKMGAKIEGLGTSTLHIQGSNRLEGAVHTVLPDRIETGTYAFAVAAAGGDVELRGARK